jgi:hypothetical protein
LKYTYLKIGGAPYPAVETAAVVEKVAVVGKGTGGAHNPPTVFLATASNVV